MRKGFPADPSQVFVTVGGKGVMLYAILGLVDPGDEVIVPDPGYPIYESLTRFVGATPVPIPIRMENDFRLDVDELATLITPRTRVLIINSPANPTGGVLTRADLERIAELAVGARPVGHDRRDLRPDPVRRRGARLDRVAARDGRADDRPRWLLEDVRDDRLAAGLRGRADVAHPDVYGQLVINTISCAPTFAQVGAVAGARRAAGRRRRDGRRVQGAGATSSSTGSTRSRASGARRRSGRSTPSLTISGTGLTGAELAERLLHEADVCVLAGTAFGGVGTRAHPHLVRQLAREPDGGARPDRPVRGRPRSWLTPAAARPRPRLRRATSSPTRASTPSARPATWTSGRTTLPPPRDELLRRVAGVDGVLTLLTDKVDDEFLDAAGPQLRVVSNYAVGFDNVDVAACARRGVTVGNTPGVLTETTADLAWALLMAAARRLPEGDRFVRDGRLEDVGPAAAARARTSTARRSGSSGSGGSARPSRGAPRASGWRSCTTTWSRCRRT